MFTVDQSAPYIVEVDDVLTSAQCAELISRIDAMEPKLATINTSQGVKVRTDVRNNERVIFDDPDLANRLFETVKTNLPSEMRNRQMVGANERFRCYRYRAGMRFAPHSDGSFVRDETEMSFFTFLVYLNEGFVGGETNFFTRPEVSIKPREGLGLLFQHPILHEGAEVTQGVKYVARTDIMYRVT